MKIDKHLHGKGEVDFDYKHDMLFFKVSEREYRKSLEYENIVLDLDNEDFLVGIQILEASKFFNIPKNSLTEVKKWRFQAVIYEGKIEVRLWFQTVIRNKTIEKNPIIMRPISDNLPNSELLCEVP